MSGVKLDRRSAMRTAEVVRRVERMPYSERDRPEEGALESVGAIFAEITVVGSDGEYEAKEQLWDGSAFADFAGARVWDGGSNLSKLQEINLSTVTGVGAIVQPWYTGDTTGGNLWMFLQPVPAVAHPFRTIIDPADNTKLKIGLDRTTNNPDTFAVGKNWQKKTAVDSFTPASGGFVVYEIRRNNNTSTGLVTDMDIDLFVRTHARSVPKDVYFDSGFGAESGVFYSGNGDNVSLRYSVTVGRVIVAGGVITEWHQHRQDNFFVEPKQQQLVLEGEPDSTKTLKMTVDDPQAVAFASTAQVTVGDDIDMDVYLHRIGPTTPTWTLTLVTPGGNPGTESGQDAIFRVGRIETVDGKLRRLMQAGHHIFQPFTIGA